MDKEDEIRSYVSKWEASGGTKNPETNRTIAKNGKVYSECQVKVERYKSILEKIPESKKIEFPMTLKFLSKADRDIYLMIIAKACYPEDLSNRIIDDILNFKTRNIYMKDHRQIHFLSYKKGETRPILSPDNFQYSSDWHCFKNKLPIIYSIPQTLPSINRGKDIDNLIFEYYYQCEFCLTRIIISAIILAIKQDIILDFPLLLLEASHQQKHTVCLEFNDINIENKVYIKDFPKDLTYLCCLK